MQPYIKNIIAILAGTVLLSSGITFASALWQGTAWISSGSVVDPTKLQQNFNYLYEQISSGAASLWSQGAAGAIYYTGGNVGVGTSSPAQKLSVVGIVESTTGGVKFPDGTVQVTAAGSSGLSRCRIRVVSGGGGGAGGYSAYSFGGTEQCAPMVYTGSTWNGDGGLWQDSLLICIQCN